MSVSAGPRVGLTPNTKTCSCVSCAGVPCTKGGNSFHKCATCGSSSSQCHGDPFSSYAGCYFVGTPNLGDHQCDCPE